MASLAWETEPSWVDVEDVTIRAFLRAGQRRKEWDLTVVVGRGPDQPLLAASDVAAELIDAQGRPLPLVERDTGLLVEAGSSLGVSANANFRFAAAEADPKEVRITYRGHDLRFQVSRPPSA